MNSPFHPEVLPGFAAYHRPMAGGPHQFRTRNDLAETNAIERGRKRSKINEAGRYPAAHNGLVAGSSPAGPTMLRPDGYAGFARPSVAKQDALRSLGEGGLSGKRKNPESSH